jgi:DNA-binding GntR family transcriptional regulator
MDGDEPLRLIAASNARRVTAVDLVRESLRSAILRGDLPGNTRLVQTEIAAQLDVSTTPVREAMRDLASEGLISLDSHKIGTVRTPDWNEMEEIVEIRRGLERLALQRAMTNISSRELAMAKDLAEQLDGEDDIGTWVQKNRDFHCIFHNATATLRLAGILEALESAGGVFVAQAQRLHPEIRERAVADHYALLAAFDANDVDAAYEIQYSHVNLPLASGELDARQD